MEINKEVVVHLGAQGRQIAEVARKYAIDRRFVSWHLVVVVLVFVGGRLFHLSLGFITLSPYGRHSRLYVSLHISDGRWVGPL